MPTAVKVVGTICNAEETIPAYLDEGSDAYNISVVIKEQAIEFFGRFQWDEMEDYLDRLTPDEREEINLSEFIDTFYGVLRGFGTPE